MKLPIMELGNATLDQLDKKAITAMDGLTFKFRDDCPQVVQLENSSYRKLRVPMTESTLASIYEGTKHPIVLVFERANADAYGIHKGVAIKLIEVPLAQVMEFMVPGDGARFVELISAYFTKTRLKGAEIKEEELDELYGQDSDFGSFA